MIVLYRRIASTNFLSFCVTTFCASLTNLTDHFLSHIIVAATSADKFWHLHCSDCRNTMIHTHTHTHTTSHALPIRNISLGSLTLPVAATRPNL
jgi:hypothetical protein